VSLESTGRKRLRWFIRCDDTGPVVVGTLAARYVGIDVAAPALALAARTLDGCPAKLDLRVGDLLEAVTATGESYDVILACFAVHHLQSQVKRASAPGRSTRSWPIDEQLAGRTVAHANGFDFPEEASTSRDGRASLGTAMSSSSIEVATARRPAGDCSPDRSVARVDTPSIAGGK
jgi:hypothetical protein